MGERASICLLTETDFITFLLFPWKSFTDFHGLIFFFFNLCISGDTFQFLCVESYIAGERCHQHLDTQFKAHMPKNIWPAGTEGRCFIFVETVQLAQRHTQVIDVHDQIKKTGCPCLNPQKWATELSSNVFLCCSCACLPPQHT